MVDVLVFLKVDLYRGGLGHLAAPDTCQVGWLVRRPGGPLRQMLK